MLGITRWTIALLVAISLPVAPAQANVVSGSVSDPRGDIHDVEGYVPMNDVLGYSASYNSDGRIDVTVQYAAFGRPEDGQHNPHPDFWVYAAFGRWDATAGRCSAPALDGYGNFGPSSGGALGDAVVGMYEGAAIPQVRAELVGYIGELRHDGLTYNTKAAKFSGYVEGAALARRDYDCVTSIISRAHSTPDTVATFCMSASGTVPCKTSAPPEVAWVSPKNGQTVSGRYREGGANNCLAHVVGPVVRTENYVDGGLHDTQVNAPWSCEWDTRDVPNGTHKLTVKAYDAGGKVIAQDTIKVEVQNSAIAPPASDDDQPDPPTTEPTDPPVVDPTWSQPAPPEPTDTTFDPLGSSSSSGPGTGSDPTDEGTVIVDPPAETAPTPFTAASARKLARSIARKRYGRHTYRITCRTSKAGMRADCKVSWRKGNRAKMRILRRSPRDRILIRR